MLLAVGSQGTKAEPFHPTTGTWSVAASMNRSRGAVTATLLPDGRVLVAGGFDGAANLASAELYDPVANRWTLTGNMAIPRREHTATLLADGRVLAADWGQADLYDPATGQFTPTGSLPRHINAVTAVRLADGRVLAVGGARGATTAAQIFQPNSRTWQPAASLNWSRTLAPWRAVLLADGRVLVVGGDRNVRFAEIWDPAAGFWTNTGTMFNARSSGFGLVRLRDGRVLLNGSANPDVVCDDEGNCETGPTHPAEIYTP